MISDETFIEIGKRIVEAIEKEKPKSKKYRVEMCGYRVGFVCGDSGFWLTHGDAIEIEGDICIVPKNYHAEPFSRKYIPCRCVETVDDGRRVCTTKPHPADYTVVIGKDGVRLDHNNGESGICIYDGDIINLNTVRSRTSV